MIAQCVASAAADHGNFSQINQTATTLAITAPSAPAD
jgi:hypothetical protein